MNALGMGPKAKRPVTVFGGFLHDLYEPQGLNKQRLAKELGVSWSTLHAWGDPEKLAVPERRTLVKIGKVLGLSAAMQRQLEQAHDEQERQRLAREGDAASRPDPPLAAPERVTEYVPRYHNLRVALAISQKSGEVFDHEAIDAAQTMVFRLGYDPLPERWIEILRKVQRDLEDIVAGRELGMVVAPEEVARPTYKRRSRS